VNEQTLSADEIRVDVGDNQIVGGLLGAGLDGVDADRAADAVQQVAFLESSAGVGSSDFAFGRSAAGVGKVSARETSTLPKIDRSMARLPWRQRYIAPDLCLRAI
jgi:hypothetical protein